MLAVGLIIIGTLASCGQDTANSLLTMSTPAGAGSAEPHLDRADDGTVVLSWLEPAGDGVALRYATLAGATWDAPRPVAGGDNWFVYWGDFPSVSPIHDDLWAAHWLVKRPGGTYAYDVAVSLSHNAGRDWREPITPHTDGTATEHGFVTLFPWQDDVGVLWLDGRHMTESTSTEHDGHGGMTLRSATLSNTGQINNGRQVDDLVCDCCQTDVAIAMDGPVAVYRNRTQEEIRDIHVARTVNGQWQPGFAVATDGWEIDGCPVNGPAVAATGKQVAVAWFTAANDQPRVRAAYSRDGGGTFAPAVDIDQDRPAGRVDIEWLDADTFAVSWVARGSEGGGALSVRAIGTEGASSPTQVIARTTTSRPSGFPQMVRHGDDLVFAWTDTQGEKSHVRTARLPISALL